MTGIFPAKLYAGTYPAIKDKLFQILIPEMEQNPLGEKIILVPSNYIAEDIYGGLTISAGKSAFNLRALTLLDFARRLLKHRRILIHEVDSITRAVLLAEIVEDTCRKGKGNSSFEKVYTKKGFVRALLRLFDEFEEGMISAKEVERLSGNPHFLTQFPDPRKIKELLGIYSTFLSGVERVGMKTRAATVRLASDGFEVPGYPFRVRLFGFYDFTRIQWVLIEKLISSGLIDDVFFPLPPKKEMTGERVIESFDNLQQHIPDWYLYAQRTLWQFLRLFDGNISILGNEHTSGRTAGSVQEKLWEDRFVDTPSHLPFSLISAPHIPGELRAVARLINMELQEGKSPIKRGVIYRRLDEATVMDVQRVFREFNLSCEIAWAVPLGRTSPVKTLLGLMKLPFREYPRRETVDMLTSPSLMVSRLHPESEEHAPLWDHVTKKVGISGGDDWSNKLGVFLTKQSKSFQHNLSLEEDGNDQEEKPHRLFLTQREIESARVLTHCIDRLKEMIEPIQRCDSYSSLSAFTLGLFRRLILLKGEGDRFHFQARALRKTFHVLKRFGELEVQGISFVSPLHALRLLENIFQEEKTPLYTPGLGRDRGTIIVGDITSLRGIHFDDVYLLGINDGKWPHTKKDVSLLKEEEREVFLGALKEAGLPPPLPRTRENLPEEKLLFCLPFIMGKNIKALSFLRSDMSGTKKIPSPFLMDLISRFRGQEIFLKELGRESVGKGFLEFPRLMRDRFTTPGRPSKREVLLSSLMKIPLDEGKPQLPKKTLAIMQRSTHTSARWHRGEDLAPDPESIGEPSIPGRNLNHTFLENYILCPYKTYLRYVLKLEPFPEPEEVFSLGRLEMGLIIHRALYLIYADRKAGPPPPSIEDAVKRAIDEHGRNNPLGLSGLQRITGKSLVKTISEFLSWEKESLQEFTPELFELKFGFEGGVDLSIDIDDRQIPISGKIDRIDRKDDSLRVIDYKLSMGTQYTPIEDKISAGMLNQIPLYAIAAQKIYQRRGIPVKTIIAGYIALRRNKKKGYFLSVRVDPGGDMISSWKRSLSLLYRSLENRSFPPMADKHFTVGRWKARYCEFCEYADICRVAPMTKGNEMIAQPFKKNVFRLYPGLSWHSSFREVSK